MPWIAGVRCCIRRAPRNRAAAPPRSGAYAVGATIGGCLGAGQVALLFGRWTWRGDPMVRRSAVVIGIACVYVSLPGRHTHRYFAPAGIQLAGDCALPLLATGVAIWILMRSKRLFDRSEAALAQAATAVPA